MIKDKFKIIGLLSAMFLPMAITSCTDVENEQIQKPYTYDEKYYENLRAYKKTEHPISFMWFADYSSSHSYGLHFLGLPDSLDMCSLWGGIPSEEQSPEVYKEMRFVQKVKGVRMNYVTIPNTNGEWAKEFMALPEEERIPAIGDHFLKIIKDNDLNGIDLDYEISGCQVTWR